MFCIHGEQEGCVSQIAHIDLAVFQENDVLVFLPLQRFRQQGAQADDFFPLKQAGGWDAPRRIPPGSDPAGMQREGWRLVHE